MERPIYLDHNATTPVAPEVARTAWRALRLAWGNPSSAHPAGVAAARAVRGARAEVARLLGCRPGEIVFTSGGTESDNAAILGVVAASPAGKAHVVTTTIEHPAVEEACHRLESRGGAVTRVPPDATGRVDPARVVAAVRPDTALVTIIHAHNETGVLQPLGEIAALLRGTGVPVHTDASQSVGKIRVDVRSLGVDLLTVAGHKLYAPKGVGALFIREGMPFEPLLVGGGQESGRRAGTAAVAQIVALGAACALARREGAARGRRLAALRDRLEGGLRERFPGLVVHGAGVPRLPNTLFCAIPGTTAERLLRRLRGVCASAGSACHAGRHEPSQVLVQMGVAPEVARATIRLSTGRGNTVREIDAAVEAIARAAGASRARA